MCLQNKSVANWFIQTWLTRWEIDRLCTIEGKETHDRVKSVRRDRKTHPWRGSEEGKKV
jgi:hypothetical protein